MNACGEYEERIQLLVDGELVGADEDETLAHIGRCATCRQTMEQLQAFSQTVRQARLQPVPLELRSRIEGLLAVDQARHHREAPKAPLLATPSAPQAQPASASIRWMGMAAALIAAVGLVFAVASSRREARAREFVNVAITEHQELADGSVPLDIKSNSPDALQTWFSQRVSFPFRMPNSGIASEDRAKYVLQGGRLVSFQGRRAALLGFKMADESISILVGSDQQARAMGGTTSYSGGIRFHTSEMDHHHVVAWDTRGLTYVLVSEQPMMKRSCAACHDGATNTTSRAALGAHGRVPASTKTPQKTSVQFLLAKASHASGDEVQSKAALARLQELDRTEQESMRLTYSR